PSIHLGRAVRHLRFFATACVVAFLLPFAVSCGGGGGSSRDDAAARMAEAADRLRGDWVLVDFRPEVGLEPMLAQLLAMQVNHLTARFDGQRLFATGV